MQNKRQDIRYRDSPNLLAISKEPWALANAAIAKLKGSSTCNKHAFFALALSGRERPFIKARLAVTTESCWHCETDTDSVSRDGGRR